MQKDSGNASFRNSKPRDMMTGLYLSSRDIQRYVNDYFNYG